MCGFTWHLALTYLGTTSSIGLSHSPRKKSKRPRPATVGFVVSKKSHVIVSTPLMSRRLLILDVNGTIADFTHKRRPGVKPDAKLRSKYIYERPHLREFLSRVTEHYDVAVWTSSIGPNAEAAVDYLFKRHNLAFVYSRNQCVKLPGPGYRTIKDLRRVWSSFPHYDRRNTTVLDDSEEKLALQPHCLLPIPTFEASQKSIQEDRCLLDALQVLLNPKRLEGSGCPPATTCVGAVRQPWHAFRAPVSARVE